MHSATSKPPLKRAFWKQHLKERLFSVLMISALAWVPRGAAKPVAEEAEPADVDLDTLQVKVSYY